MSIATPSDRTPDRTTTDDVINLTRTTPPTPAFLGHEVGKTLIEIGGDEDLTGLIRNHRFGGTVEDRAVAGTWMQQRLGAVPDMGRVLVTNGAQNAAFLLLKQLVPPGGVLLTEALTYHGVRLIADTLGIDCVGVPMDADGIDPDALDKVCGETGARTLFCMPTLQNPTSATMPLDRRRRLAEVARRNGLSIIEDDVYGLLPRDAPAPLAAIAPDVAWFVTGYGKCVAAGLRIGYLVGPSEQSVAPLFERFRTMSTWFPAPLQAALVSRWVRDGVARRVLDAIRAEASDRQAIARRALDGADMIVNDDALHVWLNLPEGRDARDFAQAAQDDGVLIRPSPLFAIDPSTAAPAVRVCTGSPATQDELRQGLSAIRRLLQK